MCQIIVLPEILISAISIEIKTEKLKGMYPLLGIIMASLLFVVKCRQRCLCPQLWKSGEHIAFGLSVRPFVRAHEKTLVEYTWNSVHRLPHTHSPSKFLRFIVNENHNGINLICIFKGNYKR